MVELKDDIPKSMFIKWIFAYLHPEMKLKKSIDATSMLWYNELKHRNSNGNSFYYLNI